MVRTREPGPTSTRTWSTAVEEHNTLQRRRSGWATSPWCRVHFQESIDNKLGAASSSSATEHVHEGLARSLPRRLAEKAAPRCQPPRPASTATAASPSLSPVRTQRRLCLLPSHAPNPHPPAPARASLPCGRRTSAAWHPASVSPSPAPRLSLYPTNHTSPARLPASTTRNALCPRTPAFRARLRVTSRCVGTPPPALFSRASSTQPRPSIQNEQANPFMKSREI
ncbi:hypothetical protein Taro_009658 [Colocasia esculenta]|uniref:Uncharacterized protein n=1 Tax=Colocasia esculenta TaxID=4460 RepID=A0A843TWX1_COLES|nr:hypothetical protein [Colocasia esculenta]